MTEERARRRLAAVLAADVVGYSRLVEQDEAGTLAALKARRKEILGPLLARHRGRLVKVMGDGVLVEFGSAVNAVACAMNLQREMAAANVSLPQGRGIVLRIAINLGDVIVEGGDSMAMASLSPCGCKHWPSPETFGSPAMSSTKWRRNLPLLTRISASEPSRTSPGHSGLPCQAGGVARRHLGRKRAAAARDRHLALHEYERRCGPGYFLTG